MGVISESRVTRERSESFCESLSSGGEPKDRARNGCFGIRGPVDQILPADGAEPTPVIRQQPGDQLLFTRIRALRGAAHAVARFNNALTCAIAESDPRGEWIALVADPAARNRRHSPAAV